MESDVGQLPLSHKAWAWFEANKKPALMGAGAIVVVGLIVSFYFYRQDEQEVAASEALSNVEVPHMNNPKTTADSPSAYLKVVADYPKSRAASRALLLAAGSLFEEGKYVEAKAQFDRFTREYASSPFMGQALLGVAACLDAQGKTDEALAAYKDLVDHHPGENTVPQARFALGRLYEAKNEIEKARNQFEEVARENPSSSLGSEAGMRLEELNLKHPKLMPTPPTSTNQLPYKIEKK
jgi:predicted negative regulator of RcsB-dependent stress response